MQQLTVPMAGSDVCDSETVIHAFIADPAEHDMATIAYAQVAKSHMYQNSSHNGARRQGLL